MTVATFETLLRRSLREKTHLGSLDILCEVLREPLNKKGSSAATGQTSSSSISLSPAERALQEFNESWKSVDSD